MRIRLLAAAAAFALALAAVAPAAAAAQPAPPLPAVAAQDTGSHGASAESTSSGLSANTDRILWSLLAIALAVPLGGIFYLLKKRLGAFPEQPEWVAPISVMRSRDLPDERTYQGSDAAAGSHGHH